MKTFIVQTSCGSLETVNADSLARDHIGWVVFYQNKPAPADQKIMVSDITVEVVSFFAPAYIREQ